MTILEPTDCTQLALGTGNLARPCHRNPTHATCGKGDWLYFHWKTILLPARIAEYVVVHEIAHLHEPHHGPAFWLRVERVMPDYAQCKTWLAEHGIDVEGI